jgi:hypothetical protein
MASDLCGLIPSTGHYPGQAQWPQWEPCPSSTSMLQQTILNTEVLSSPASILTWFSPSSPPPLLVGDFNCVLHAIDCSSNTPLLHHSTSNTLPALLSAASYSDSFRVLHPTTRVFFFQRRGSKPRGWIESPSLPPHRVVHFLPAFRTFWRPLADSQPRTPDGPDSTTSTASQPPSPPPPGTPNPPPRTSNPPHAPSTQSASPRPNPDPILGITDLPTPGTYSLPSSPVASHHPA